MFQQVMPGEDLGQFLGEMVKGLDEAAGSTFFDLITSFSLFTYDYFCCY